MSENEVDPIIQRTDEIKARGKSPARIAPDPVNVPMIRHWAEAIGDTNPRWAPGPDTEAPPAMAQVWTMYGLNPERMEGDPLPDTMQVIDDAGFTSVLGTNCDRRTRARCDPARSSASAPGSPTSSAPSGPASARAISSPPRARGPWATKRSPR